jgi:glycosyltransferase involved in cell wall biosynthesis
MNIGIDAHMLGHRETGNETYILQLTQALTEVDDQDDFFVAAEDRELLSPDIRRRRNVHVLELRTRSAVFRLLVELPGLARRHRFDVLHCTYHVPPRCPCPLVVTVHDISFERHPEFFSIRDRFVLGTLVPHSVRQAHQVITDTEFAKRDLMEIYHLPANKINVTNYAAGQQFHPIQDLDLLSDVRKRYQTSDRFILTVGNLQPRKNLVRLVNAYAQMKQAHGLAHKLVIVGQSAWKSSAVFKAVETNGLDDDVFFTGFIPAEDLPLLYTAAQVFVYPSLYEGFGLPVLEAMACGTPVITSNSSSLPEIAEGAARLVDPRNTDDLAAALVQVLSDQGLQKEMREKGLARARTFSWERTAHQTLEVYRQVARV